MDALLYYVIVSTKVCLIESFDVSAAGFPRFKHRPVVGKC